MPHKAVDLGIRTCAPRGDRPRGGALTNDDGSASPAATSKIAFVGTRIDSRVHVELYVMNADGSGKRRLLETARSGPAHERRCNRPCRPGPRPLPYEPYEISSNPAWSPDGRWIAFVGMGDDANVDVYVVRADGRGQQRLTRHPAVEGNPAWSPNGRKIAFTRRGARETFQIYVMNADGSSQRRLTRNPARDGGPVWSPDGRQIAFTRGWNETSRKIYVMNADGSGQRSLTPARSRSFYPAWSPDGRKIVFAGGKPLVPPDGIYVMNADGSEQRRLTQHGSGPAWSPDGQMIAFGCAHSTGAELHVMNADGSGQRRLTRDGVRVGPYAWSPKLPKRP